MGPAPGGPAGGRARAAEPRSRRGAARGGAGRARRWLGGRGGGAGAGPGAGPGGDAPPPGREEAPAGRARGAQGKPRGRAGQTAPRPFRQPPGARALQVGSPRPEGQKAEERGALDPAPPRPPNFPDQTRTSTFFFSYKMYSSSLKLKNKSMYKTGSDQAPLTHSQTPADFLPGPPRRAGPPGGSQRVGEEVALIWGQFGQEGGGLRGHTGQGRSFVPRARGRGG